MAAPPSTASQTSWNPAVPPPPVTGAAVGIGLGEGLGDALSVGDPLWVADSDELAWVFSFAGEFSEVPPLVVLVALGDNTDSDAEGVPDAVPVPVPVPDPVQAESATQASTVIRPQPTAVSLTPRAVPAMAVRPLIGPPSYSRQ
jgi:hypothetical protein